MVRRKTIIWLLVLAALVLYSLLVYSWWIEGNTNFEQQRIEMQNESAFSRH